jgi:hypothetical protein
MKELAIVPVTGGLTTEEAWARVMEGYNEKKSSEAKRATLIEQRTT